MRRITAFLAFALALVVGLTGVSAAPAQAAEDDVATVISRLEEYYIGQGDEIIIANGIYLARTSEALGYVASQNEDGSWSDVDYADRTSSANGSVWGPYVALYRMLAMTHAYKDPKADGFGDPRLVEAVGRALLHWDRVDPGNQNWWEPEIGESIAMGRISMSLRDDLSDEAFQVSLKHNSGKLDPVGANGAWRTSNYLFEALATNDIDKAKEGFATIVATIAVDHSGTVKEAVQPDGSFWAHGPQLYSEGYGMVLFTYAALWADVASGTSLAFTRDQLDAIAFFAVNGTRWLIRGEIGMLYLNYRPPKTIKGVTSHASEFIEPLERMVRADPLYATQYQAVLDGVMGDTRTNGVTGDKYFWRSEFSSHIRDDYGIFTRLNSSRTIGGELRTTYREELGNPTYWNSMGATAIQVNNREYLDLGPTFDWWHYPGVTAPYEKRTERGVLNRSRNGDGASFTGGVSDGEYGANVLTLDAAATQGQKSYFLFDEGLVALGAGIRSSSDAAVHTTIDQAAAKDNASVGGTGITDADGQSTGDARWAYNDETGYVFAEGQDVKVSDKTQSGSWIDEDTVERDAFSLYVDHGVAPSDGQYDYTVLPAATPDEVETYAEHPTVQTLRNDTDVQAATQESTGITMATFYGADSLDLGDGRTLTVDQPGIVILDERGEIPVVSISNPDRPGLNVGVTLTGGGQDWHGAFALGSDENTGKTVTAALAAGELPASSGFTASSTAQDSSVDAVGDGDTETAWYSDGAGTQWISETLARGSWVTNVTIDWADAPASDFIVQTSQNGTDWTDQARVRAGEDAVSDVPIDPTAAEHVRVLLLDAPALDGPEGDRYGIRELTTTSTVNLAIDAGTRASGFSDTNLVHTLADGDPETRWRGNNSDSAWAQIDLGETTPVSTIRLSWEAAYAKAYKIQLSDDGANWRDAYTTPSGGSDGGVDVMTLDDQSARFVRMQTVTRALDYGPSIWEFEVFSDRLIADAPSIPSGNANLALGRPTTADSVYNDLANIQPQMATDGSTGTKWSSDRAAEEHWLQVDLGAVTSVSRAVVAWETGTSDDYRLEGSADGETWMPLAEVHEAQPTLTHTHDFTPTEVRYVRLTGIPATKYGLNVWELELYGGGTFECTGPVSAGRDGSAIVAATASPLIADDTYTAVSMDEQVATVAGDARVSDDGRIEFDLATHEPGHTRVLLRHAVGVEVAWCDVTVVADTSRLQSQIDAANGLDSSAYTSDSWAPVLPALEHAKDLIRAPGSPQDQVDAAASALEAALAGLLRRDAVPSAPLDVVASASAGLVDVQWSAPESIGGSEITAYEVAVGDETVQTEASVLSAQVTDLAAGEYPVTVRAQNDGGWSEPSEPVTVVVDPAVVTPIVRVEGEPVVGGDITITGSDFAPGTEYVVQLRSTPADLGTVTADDDGAFSFTGVVPSDVEAGEHTVAVMLDGEDVATTRVIIGEASDPGTPGGPGGPGHPGDDGSLPTTGGDLGWLPWTIGAAMLLLAAGLTALLIRRRQRD